MFYHFKYPDNHTKVLRSVVRDDLTALVIFNENLLFGDKFLKLKVTKNWQLWGRNDDAQNEIRKSRELWLICDSAESAYKLPHLFPYRW